MATYHFQATIHSRSSGASAVARAAYRAREVLADERTGERHDYSRRGGVDGAEIIAPENAPAWVRDRSRLWNAVEAAERRRDAQVAREVIVALPRELSADQRRHLVRGFVRSQFVSKGMVADVAYHGGSGDNPHAHILLTTRAIGPAGFGKKDREWNKRTLVSEWRETWAHDTNAALARASRPERVSALSIRDRRAVALANDDMATAEKFDRVPEPKLGPTAWEAARTKQANPVTEAHDLARGLNASIAREQGIIRAALREIERITRQAIERVRPHLPSRPGMEWSR